MREYLSKRVMLTSGILSAFIAIIGYYFKNMLPVFAIVISGFLGFLVYKNDDKRKFVAVIMVAIVLLVQICTYSNAEKLYNYVGMETESSFIVKEIVYKGDGFSSAEISIVESDLLPRGTKISVTYNGSLYMGNIVSGKLKLKSIKNNDFETNYFSKGIYLRANLNEYKITEKDGNLIICFIAKVREYIKNTIFDYCDYDNAATLLGLILGENNYFTNEFRNNVRASGVSHIMVVSGMHLGILILLLTKLTDGFIYNRYLKAGIIVLSVLFLSLLCGGTMSIIRAGFTYILIAIGLIIGRNGVPENTLGAVVTLIHIGVPFAALNVSFQLSVLSTFGILCIASPISRYIKDKKLIKSKFLYGLTASVFVTSSATLLTLPIIINIYGTISTVTIITNLIITYLITLVLWFVLFALFFNLFFPSISVFLFFICEAMVEFLNFIINYFGGLKFSIITVPKYVAFIIIAFIIVFFYVLIACKKRINMIKLNKLKNTYPGW